jgi:primary-amine oxidase
MTREITQPDGPSSIVDGWKVQWQKWSMRVGFNPREGITLHEITYTDRGETRPIIYRASLSEMVVTYGDTRPAHWNKNVFDMGEVGMGFSANPLTLGCDCLGEIYYDDGTVNDSSGNAVTIPNVICMHEEDYGISWEHIDFRTGEVEVRNDASMEVEVKLSGVLTTGAVADGEEPRWGKAVRAQHLRPQSPAFLQLPARHERRRCGQQRVRGRLASRTRPGAQSTPQRVDHPRHLGGLRGRWGAGLGLVEGTLLEDHQPFEAQ